MIEIVMGNPIATVLVSAKFQIERRCFELNEPPNICKSSLE